MRMHGKVCMICMAFRYRQGEYVGGKGGTNGVHELKYEVYLLRQGRYFTLLDTKTAKDVKSRSYDWSIVLISIEYRSLFTFHFQKTNGKTEWKYKNAQHLRRLFL